MCVAFLLTLVFSSIGIAGCLGVQKWHGSVFFFFHYKSAMLIELRWE